MDMRPAGRGTKAVKFSNNSGAYKCVIYVNSAINNTRISFWTVSADSILLNITSSRCRCRPGLAQTGSGRRSPILSPNRLSSPSRTLEHHCSSPRTDERLITAENITETRLVCVAASADGVNALTSTTLNFTHLRYYCVNMVRKTGPPSTCTIMGVFSRAWQSAASEQHPRSTADRARLLTMRKARRKARCVATPLAAARGCVRGTYVVGKRMGKGLSRLY